ncbi:MAG: lipopolysaccharide ABC transporter ATP-binding protein, partial [Desulfobacteria bacterium]
NVRETLGVCDQVYILNEGVLIESGPPEAITSSSLAREVYLGENFRL